MFKTHASSGGEVSTGEFGVDLYAKIWKPTPSSYMFFKIIMYKINLVEIPKWVRFAYCLIKKFHKA